MKKFSSSYQLAVVNQGHIDEACSNLIPGDEICLGNAGEDCTTTYTVKDSDTCDGINTAHGLNSTILSLNNPQINEACDNIYIGEVSACPAPLHFFCLSHAILRLSRNLFSNLLFHRFYVLHRPSRFPLRRQAESQPPPFPLPQPPQFPRLPRLLLAIFPPQRSPRLLRLLLPLLLLRLPRLLLLSPQLQFP